MKISRREMFALSFGGAAGLALGRGLTQVSGAVWSAVSGERPWWVRRVEEPTVSIDDAVYRRFDSIKNVFGSFRKYYGERNVAELRKRSKERMAKYFKEDRAGFTLRDRALADAAWALSRMGGLNRGLRSWNRLAVSLPEQYGVERYSASRKEAAQTVKAAARYFGSALTGIAKLDRRHINAKDYGREIVFEDADEPSFDQEKQRLTIPSKCEYAIAVSVQMSLEAVQCSPSGIGSAGSSLGYSRIEFVVGALAEFIRALGYTAIPSVNDLGSSVAIAVDAGLGELGRTNRLISPEFGPNLRLGKVLTDMPLEVDGPIDFGLKQFCRVCKKCAERCPSGCLSMEDEPSFEIKGPWNNPGHEAWFEESPKCLAYWSESTSGCSVCIGVCPFSKGDDTFLHEFVKAASSTAPVFDGALAIADNLVGYGQQRDPAAWWRTDMPEYGIDTTQAKRL